MNFGALQSTGASEISGLTNIENLGTFEVQSGSLKLDAGVSGTGTLTIDAGATLELTSFASGVTVAFSSGTGMLKLDQAENFNGAISGFTGTSQSSSDQIDLADINFNSSSFNELLNSSTNTLTVTDGTHTAVIHFSSAVTLNFSPDGTPINGAAGTSGTLIYDPPGTNQSVTPVVAYDPGPATTATITATAPNQTLTGLAASDNFVFNFAGVGHATVADFHPLSDTLQFDKSIFANIQAVLNATQDDGHGNTIIGVDGHDSITLSGVLKSQLHIADFHIA